MHSPHADASRFSSPVARKMRPPPLVELDRIDHEPRPPVTSPKRSPRAPRVEALTDQVGHVSRKEVVDHRGTFHLMKAHGSKAPDSRFPEISLLHPKRYEDELKQFCPEMSFLRKVAADMDTGPDRHTWRVSTVKPIQMTQSNGSKVRIGLGLDALETSLQSPKVSPRARWPGRPLPTFDAVRMPAL